MANDKKDYWFKSKRYGWGWGLPANRKGWLAFGLFFAIWLAALAWLATSYSDLDKEPSATNTAIFLVILAIDVLGLMYVSFKHGESPKWRWGKKHGSKES